MNKIREILLHICVICSFCCIAAKILDWYNPYMDFSGHIVFIQFTLYIGVLIAAFMKKRKRRITK